jgi:hypothetical protein
LYQRARQKKLQRKADAEAEARKGFTVTVDGEPIHLPIVYGRQKIGGARTFHSTKNSYNLQPLQSGFERFNQDVTDNSATFDTPQALFVQQALCFGGIDGIIDLEVDGVSWDKEEYKHILDVSLNGSVANATATANGIPSTNKFTNVSYLTGMFILNRDDPQYNGVPDISAFVRGNRVLKIQEVAGVYSMTSTPVFSTNPAYILLDYLTRPKVLGGCGYSLGDIDLPTFYKAAQICDTTVETNVDVAGRVNGVRPVEEGETVVLGSRDINLYECNITIDTAQPRRDNIERLLETMAQSELIWSEGVYKLVLDYPSNETAQTALVTASYTDDDIVNSELNIVWAGVSDKFNRSTVKFLNEEQDFATDSVSWPVYGSASHSAYLAADNGIENEIDYFIQGATHRKSALAKAEELVRNSRISKIVNFEITRDGLIHEQGDLISISSASAGIVDEIYRIEEINITANLSVKISAVRFDYQTLAYNVSDSYVTNPKTTLPSQVPNVVGLTWNEGSRVGGLSNGWLSWDAPADQSVRRFLIYFREVSGNYVSIGETRTNYFDIPAQLNDGTDYYFLVRTESSLGRLSEGSIILLDQLAAVVPLIGTTASVGINSVTLKWTDPNPELALRYDIYQSNFDTRGAAVFVGSSTTNTFIVSPLAVANYYFWVDVIGNDGAVGLMNSGVYVSELSLGIITGDIPALDAIEAYMTDSVFLQAASGSATGELQLATYSDGVIDVSTARISADAILLDGTVTADLINVTELSAITANIGLFRSAETGERVEIENDRIRVFDNNNILRVVLGNLS